MSTPVKRMIAALASVALAAQFACGPDVPRSVSPAEKKVIADSLKTLVVNAYDLARPGVVDRMMSLYPENGPVYSTSSGHISTTRAELKQQIGTFWQYVGSNMRNPKWQWTAIHTDVLSPDAAVMTASYKVDHLTPMNMPHAIAGAWTAVFVNRGGRWVVIHEHLSDTPTTQMETPMEPIDQ
ncbi:MAG: nuclear transport factor 2 family protein [Gemmatimonadaceae bacterium]